MTSESEQEILRELRDIKNEVTKTTCAVENMEDDRKRIQEWLQNIERELGGNETVKGLRTRVTEIETTQKSQVWYWRAMITGLIGTTLGWIASIFGEHK